MNRTIPLEKRSKRDRRAYYSDRRSDWNGVIPVTRVIPGKKGYDRNRHHDLNQCKTFVIALSPHIPINPYIVSIIHIPYCPQIRCSID